jgi:hypothetical protein
MNNLGNLLHARGLAQPKFKREFGMTSTNTKREKELQQGAALLRESLEASRAVHGPKHLDTLISASNLGSALRSLGSDGTNQAISEEASSLIQDAVEGIADAWASENLEHKPRAREALRQGLEDVLAQPSPVEATTNSADASVLGGTFVRSLLSPEKQDSPSA